MADSIRDALLSQGYFELPERLPRELIARAREDVSAREHAVDAFLDDAMWDILDAVLPIARDALAHDVEVLPAFWAWRVRETERGWMPHRDFPSDAHDDSCEPTRLTIWVPLTDATTRNGCIHVLPAYWDYAYFSPQGGTVVDLPQDIRALPATAGSVLGWSHSLLHWGGACAPGESPRISTSFELIRSDHASRAPRTFAPGWRPSTAERTALLAEMRAKYKHMLRPDVIGE